jgi:hypothetical protein
MTTGKVELRVTSGRRIVTDLWDMSDDTGRHLGHQRSCARWAARIGGPELVYL